MKLSQFKNQLEGLEEVRFILPNGTFVPAHFHVTEVGKIDKHFIDCGGTLRNEAVINFQLWTAQDYDHRLSGEKLRSIIALSEEHLGLADAEIEVEYQGDTIGKYGLDFEGENFLLTSTHTDCLAKDNCGVPVTETAEKEEACCTPGGGCC